MVSANNIIDFRSAEYKASAKALGPVGFVRFVQQYDNGSGDYTLEKYAETDDFENWDQLENKLKKFHVPDPVPQMM